MTDLAQMDKLVAARHGERAAGAWASAPAIPASTVTAQNTSGKNAMVLVVGGTVTAIKVDGVTVTGITAGWVPVPDLATIAITYSVVPTSWQWWLMA